jgi:hypothetical protein
MKKTKQIKKELIRTKQIKKELKTGAKMEMEHTKSKRKARKIAEDHLKEFPKYYDKKVGLPAMEKRMMMKKKAKKKVVKSTKNKHKKYGE